LYRTNRPKTAGRQLAIPERVEPVKGCRGVFLSFANRVAFLSGESLDSNEVICCVGHSILHGHFSGFAWVVLLNPTAPQSIPS
jgi:hypothetical protein